MLFSGIPVKKFENSWDRMLPRQLCRKYLQLKNCWTCHSPHWLNTLLSYVTSMWGLSHNVS